MGTSRKFSFRLLSRLLGGVVLWAFATQMLEAETSETASDFVRYVEGAENQKLQVASVTYLNADGVIVELIGAVHLGDRTYYDALNERFKSYEAVLFELVGDPGALLGQGIGQPNAIRMLQTTLTRLLALEFQLDAIDYTPANFVHADLTMEEFVTLQDERGETIFTLVENLMRKQLESGGADVPQIGLFELITAFASNDSAGAFKVLLARELAGMEDLILATEQEKGTVLFTERNKRVIKTLEAQIEKGTKRMAIFFGAAHHIGLEQDLLHRGFQKVGQTWMTAWNIQTP